MQKAQRSNASHTPENQTPQSSPRSPSPFVKDIIVDHGPTDVLGRFFLQADEAARDRGVTLAFASLSDLQEANKANRDSWGTLMPMFDPTQSEFDEETSLCLLGYDHRGDVVATQSARYYDLTNTTLRSKTEDLSLFFGDKSPPSGAQCTVTAKAADEVTGGLVYSGSTWFRPDYRKCGLATLLPRISRSTALTRWNTDYTTSFVEWILVEKNVVARYGYTRVDDGIEMEGIVDTKFVGGIACMHRDQLIDDLKSFSPASLPKVNVRFG